MATGCNVIVLSVNVGSSSVKLSLHDIQAADHAALLNGSGARQSLWEHNVDVPANDWPGVIASAWSALDSPMTNKQDVQAVGHRIVHGGRDLHQSVRITSATCDAIARAGESAPSHNALELAAIKATTQLLGDKIPQTAVFDTAFHSTLPDESFTFAGPHEWLDQGIRRFGFHGISHSYASRRAAALLHRDVASLRLVTCHLGGGCSLAAVQAGVSVDTTMGFTPLDGIVMATRSGSVDAGILFHLLRYGKSAEELEHTLNHDSGLAGLSGMSGDMRELLAAINNDSARAQLAFRVYLHRLRQGIASMAASMGGMDALVFTGGVGEHSPVVRLRTCETLNFLGVHVDDEANVNCAGDAIISPSSSPVAVAVVAAQENFVIACEAAQLAR